MATVNSKPDQTRSEAVRALQAGRPGDAQRVLEAYLQDQPDDLVATTMLADALLRQRDVARSEDVLKSVLARAQDFRPARMLLARCLAAQVRIGEAISVIEQATSGEGGDLGGVRQLADLHAMRGDFGRAGELYAGILRTPRATPDDYFKHAQNLRAWGKSDEAVAALRHETQVFPKSARPWWMLARFFPGSLVDDDEADIRAALDGEPDRPDLLRIALSIILDRRGNHQGSYEIVSAIKQTRAARSQHDPDRFDRDVDELISEAAKLSTEKHEAAQGPIFIVGMPRAGSTLVERILGRHSKIEALGEIDLLPRLLFSMAPAESLRSAAVLPSKVPGSTLQQVAETYIERSREFRRTTKPLFTDKHNANWIRAPLIRRFFPGARIIDVRRSAIDCCWSMYRTMYGDDYANDQRTLARYYAAYARTMDAVVAASPDACRTLNYEDLVADPEATVRSMLEFLGLEFEPECLDFHLSDDAVSTLSSEQVRQPLNRTGIGSAGPYAQWLGPMIEELARQGIPPA